MTTNIDVVGSKVVADMPSLISNTAPFYSWTDLWRGLFASTSAATSTVELCSQAAIRAAETIQATSSQPVSQGDAKSDFLQLASRTLSLDHDPQRLYQLVLAFLAGMLFWVFLDVLVLIKLAWRNFFTEMETRLSPLRLRVPQAPSRGQARLSSYGHYSSGNND